MRKVLATRATRHSFFMRKIGSSNILKDNKGSCNCIDLHDKNVYPLFHPITPCLRCPRLEMFLLHEKKKKY